MIALRSHVANIQSAFIVFRPYREKIENQNNKSFWSFDPVIFQPWHSYKYNGKNIPIKKMFADCWWRISKITKFSCLVYCFLKKKNLFLLYTFYYLFLFLGINILYCFVIRKNGKDLYTLAFDFFSTIQENLELRKYQNNFWPLT